MIHAGQPVVCVKGDPHRGRGGLRFGNSETRASRGEASALLASPFQPSASVPLIKRHKARVSLDEAKEILKGENRAG